MLIKITSLTQPGIDIFSSLTETQLRKCLEPEKGIFIAESPKVINIALDNGYQPISILCEEKHIHGDAAPIISKCKVLNNNDIPIYTGERALLKSLTGYSLTRGVLCAMIRPKLPSVEDVCKNAKRIVIINGVVDSTNIGAIFRSAAALGIDGILVTPNSCDPLNRRAIRVSMGSVFLMPWTWIEQPLNTLNELGFKTIAMALTDKSLDISSPILKNIEKMAIIMGTEGDGLPMETIKEADFVARIPMSHNVDSLNVAAAAAVAFWELNKK